MKPSAWLLVIFTLIHLRLVAQSESSVVEVKINSPFLELVPIGEKGFVMFEYQGSNLNSNQIGMMIYCYDIQLRNTWKNLIAISKGLHPAHYLVSDGKFIMIFADTKYQQWEMFSLNLDGGDYQVSKYEFSSPFIIESMLAIGFNTWVAGKMMNQGVLFELNSKNNSYQIIPTAFANPVTSVKEINFDQSSSTLIYLLKTSVNNRQSFVIRSFEVTKNKVINDLTLEVPESYQLDHVKLTRVGTKVHITGTFYKRNIEQTIGLFQYSLEQGKVTNKHFKLFRELPGFYEYTLFQEDEYTVKKSRKGPVQAIMDEVIFKDGSFFVSLELIKKDYRPKGTLQKEFEQNRMVNYLDRDQTGRRSFDQASAQFGDEKSAEDRIYQGSATDILSYRYRNAITGQPMFMGYTYQRSILLHWKDGVYSTICNSARPPDLDLYFMATSNTLETPQGIRQVYDKGGIAFSWLYNSETNEFMSFKQTAYLSGKGRVFHLKRQHYLAAWVDKSNDQYHLKFQKVRL